MLLSLFHPFDSRLCILTNGGCCMGSSMSVTLPFSTTIACAKTLQSVSIGVSFGPGLTNTVWGSGILVITAVWKTQWNRSRSWHITKKEKPLYWDTFTFIYPTLVWETPPNHHTSVGCLYLWPWWSVFWHFPSRTGEGSQDLNSVCSPTSLPFTARLL